MRGDAFNGIELTNNDEGMFDDDICWGCNGLAYAYWDSKYKGWRGKCPDCDTNWPLS